VECLTSSTLGSSPYIVHAGHADPFTMELGHFVAENVAIVLTPLVFGARAWRRVAVRRASNTEHLPTIVLLSEAESITVVSAFFCSGTVTRWESSALALRLDRVLLSRARESNG